MNFLPFFFRFDGVGKMATPIAQAYCPLLQQQESHFIEKTRLEKPGSDVLNPDPQKDLFIKLEDVLTRG